MAKIYVVFYSMYGHVYKLAQKVKEGIDAIPGCEGVLYQVPELLDQSILDKMHAPPKPDVPIITASMLTDADGFVFGFPTRFGMMAAQMKAFFDSTGQLWQKGALAGKPASMFTSTACQGGGQEVTLLTAITQLVHHGMIYVPQGYTAGPGMFDLQTPKGGSAFGPGTLAGPDGSRQPSELELEHSMALGKLLAGVAQKLKA